MKRKKFHKLPDHGRQVIFHIEYILLLGLAGVGFFFYQNYAFFLCLSVLVLLPAYTHAAAVRLQKTMELSISFSYPAVAKHTETIAKITIKNRSIFPSANCFLRVKAEHAFYPNEEVYYLNLPVAAKDTREISWKVMALGCGILRVTVEEVVLRDMCNFWSLLLPAGQTAEVAIMPLQQEIQIEEDIHASQEGEGEETQIRKGDDPSILFDIRSYIPGDRLQRIHWKLTARQDELMVKEYGETVDKQIHILLELYQKEEQTEELEDIIAGFYSLGLLLLQEREKFFVYWWNLSVGQLESGFIQEEEDLYEVLSRIYLCRLYSEAGLAYGEYQYQHASGEAVLFYITARGEAARLGGRQLCQLSNEVVVTCL